MFMKSASFKKSEDPEHPPSSAEKMVQKLTNCKTEHALIEDAGDPVYRDKPTETLKILKSFINQHHLDFLN